MSKTPLRLLLLEDNEGDAQLVQTALDKEAPGEFAITTVERLTDALTRIKAERFDVALCDLGLPDSSGLATAKEIIAHGPDLPLVVLTGSHKAALGPAAIALGAQDYLVKGEFRAPMLARALRYAVERKRLEAELRAEKESLEQRVAERTADLDLANRVLQSSVERYRAVTQTATDAIITAGSEGVIEDWNAGATRLFGYEQAEAVGQPLTLLIPQRFRDGHLDGMKRVQSGGERHAIGKTVELAGLRKDTSEFPMELSLSEWMVAGRQHFTGTIRDISERKRVDEEIRRHVEDLRIAFMSTVEVATTLSEMRDPYTAGHMRRVGAIAAAVGAHLGFDENRQQGLRVAGQLHDVGKIMVPAEILAKPGQLNTIELALIQGHAQAGYEVLKNVQFPWPLAQVALQHHERLNGSGYPQGLKGEAILIEARIMAVADVVEAMSSHRPYRSGLGIDKALAEVERGRGTLFDAAVVDACLTLFREKGYTVPK